MNCFNSHSGASNKNNEQIKKTVKMKNEKQEANIFHRCMECKRPLITEFNIINMTQEEPNVYSKGEQKIKKDEFIFYIRDLNSFDENNLEFVFKEDKKVYCKKCNLLVGYFHKLNTKLLGVFYMSAIISESFVIQSQNKLSMKDKKIELIFKSEKENMFILKFLKILLDKLNQLVKEIYNKDYTEIRATIFKIRENLNSLNSIIANEEI